ncbi:lysophospholipase [Daedaleopsis nitida]|nr:lysophospholipase [Daedaleopsis nitida]
MSSYTEAWLPGRNGVKFYTRSYRASSPRAVVLFLHGFAEYVGRYEWVHGEYASRGITVFAYDQRGFGLTALDREHKSKESKYGRTSWHDQLADVEWWLRYVKDQYPTPPLFLMGNSMGGGLSLAIPTRTSSPPGKDTISLVSGVIAISPLLLLTHPTSRILRFLAKITSSIFPTVVVPAPVDSKTLSHDKAVVEAHARDPLCPQKGSVKGIHDMLTGGEQLLYQDYKNWPQDLPVLLAHGDADAVTSFSASRNFYEKVWAHDKDFLPYEDGFHELVHDTVKEKFVDDCISWILRHVST